MPRRASEAGSGTGLEAEIAATLVTCVAPGYARGGDPLSNTSEGAFEGLKVNGRPAVGADVPVVKFAEAKVPPAWLGALNAKLVISPAANATNTDRFVIAISLAGMS